MTNFLKKYVALWQNVLISQIETHDTMVASNEYGKI